VNKTNWQHVAREIQNGLPKPLNERRCRLLPEILSEWERTDLQRHRSQESRTEIRAKVKKLETVKKSALQLMKALDNVDESGHADIVFQMVIAERGGSRTPGAVRQVEFATRIDRLSQESEFLANWPLSRRKNTGRLHRGGHVTSLHILFCKTRPQSMSGLPEGSPKGR
jgi:hypothetical protein